MDLIVELIKLGSVGVISSFVAYYLAFRGHRHKKWWELKVSAYKDTIEALSDLLDEAAMRRKKTERSSG